MYRRVPERTVIAHFNDELIAYVNTEIASCSGSSSEGPANRLFSTCTYGHRSLDADAHESVATVPCSRLVAETNAERARSANEIPVGTHGFDLAYSVTDLIAPICGPVNATIFPNSPAATSSTAVAPNIEHNARSNVVGDPPR